MQVLKTEAVHEKKGMGSGFVLRSEPTTGGGAECNWNAKCKSKTKNIITTEFTEQNANYITTW